MASAFGLPVLVARPVLELNRQVLVLALASGQEIQKERQSIRSFRWKDFPLD